MRRLFSVQLSDPTETARGGIDLFYRQENVKAPLEVSAAGRGLQQMLLIFAYLYSHRKAVLLIDEPDAHLEILRQRQVYVLLREIAARNESQVVLVTHSEVVLAEALGRNVTLLGERLGHPMLLRKGELHRLIRSVDPESIAPEVGEKLGLLERLLDRSERVEARARP